MTHQASRVMVTGATGFLGAHLCRSLVAAGHHVRALCRDPQSSAARALPDVCERIAGDILDPAAVDRAAQDCDTVYHCAGKVSREDSDSQLMYDLHVRGTEITLSRARAAGVRTVIIASTSGTMALAESGDHVADETNNPPPGLIARLPYYRSKLYGERAALAMDDGDFRVVSINPTLLLGPGDRHGSSTLDVRRFIERPMPVLPAGGISFVDARDVAETMLVAARRGRGGARYLLTACNCTTRTFFARVARVAGVREPLASLPRGAASRRATTWLAGRLEAVLGRDDRNPDAKSLEYAHFNWYADPSRAEAELAWRPRDAMQTLADTVRDLHIRGVVEVPALIHTTGQHSQ